MGNLERSYIDEARRLLEEVVGEDVTAVSLSGDIGCDLGLDSGSHFFLVQMKQAGTAASVHAGTLQLRKAASTLGTRKQGSAIVVPLLVVPYMGEVGRRLCEEEGLAWLDLSGNAQIRAPGLRVFVSGHENRFKRRGRRSTPFAPQASRLARQFLLDSQRPYTQKDLVELTGLDQGFVSRLLRGMVEEGLLKQSSRTYEATKPSLLLKAWEEVYDFTKHRIIKGHVATRSSEDLLTSLSKAFSQEGLLTSATGLAGAWLLTRFASFRLVTLYVDKEPSRKLLTKVGFREEERGANTWLVVPNDEGVFVGCQERDGISCAHPVQVYLDLKFQPERSDEAAQRLKEMYLVGDDHA